MGTRRLVREGWQAYFEAVSRQLGAQRVEIRVEGLDIGDQIAAEHLELLGLAYDAKDDQIRVITELLDHAISSPVELFVEESASGLECFEVKTSDGRSEIVRLTAALSLPA